MVAVALVVAAVFAAGCGGSGGGEEAAQPTLSTMSKIRDRAIAEGYEVLKCQTVPGVKCVNGITVVSSGGKIHSAGFILAKDGLWSPGLDTINVYAYPDPKDLRGAEEGHRDSAAEREWLKKGLAVDVLVGDRIWSTYSPEAKVPRQKFLDIVGKLEGCAPNCRFTAPSTAKPATTTGEAPELGPATARQAAMALGPIVRRAKAAGYVVSPPVGTVVSMTGEEGVDAGVTVYATPAGSRDVGRLEAEAIKRGGPSVEDFAVIGNRIWETYTPDATENFRKTVETAEGCAPKCRFSMSSFNY